MEPIHRTLDHAVLKPEMTQAEAEAQIRLGLEYAVRTVCVRPCDLALAQRLCAGTTTDVCVVLGFPHGCGLSAAKAAEARLYREAGVAEVDMVANYGWIRSGAWDAVEADIRAVHEVLAPAGIPLKVIFETAFLSDEQIRQATELCATIGVAFVKTSTGFNGGGATEEAVRAMLETARGRVQVKPSGGIRTREQAQHFLEMGATRLGVGSATTPVLCDPSTEGPTAAAGEY